ncbi:MAG: universal stress protein [bacterium]|nr:universal stress protein [bacterium]MDI1334961.1 universal stress protein [Lacunisphaera sp.]
MTSPAVMGRVKASYPRLLHLLVPLDFSGKSRQALRYAIPLAQKFSARIHLVHVLPSKAKADLAKSARLRHTAIKRLGEMSGLLPPRLRAGNAVLTGNPAEAILTLAAKNNIDLIVLTTKGRTGLKRVLVGSTAEHIVRHANCPVMSVRRR